MCVFSVCIYFVSIRSHCIGLISSILGHARLYYCFVRLLFSHEAACKHMPSHFRFFSRSIFLRLYFFCLCVVVHSLDSWVFVDSRLDWLERPCRTTRVLAFTWHATPNIPSHDLDLLSDTHIDVGHVNTQWNAKQALVSLAALFRHMTLERHSRQPNSLIWSVSGRPFSLTIDSSIIYARLPLALPLQIQ